MAGLVASFGSGAMTNSFAHLQKAKLVFLIGSNITEAHPVAGGFLKQAVRNGCRLVVADPRRTGIAAFAERHLQLRVGSDIALLNSLMYVIIVEKLYDKEFVVKNTEGFDEFQKVMLEYPPARVEGICGVSASTITETARILASAKPGMLCYTLGITEHTCGVGNVRSCANLQMLLGNMGKELGGLNPLRGQNNVQGACDMGALPDIFPGYQKVADPFAREKFARFWGISHLSDTPGLMMPDMLEGLLDKSVRGFYVFGENLACSEPDIRHIEHCLGQAEFLVVQDIFPTETTRFANVILPAAAWSENDGTFTNSERRVSRVRTASRVPGQARPNWWIFKELAKRFSITWESDSAQEIWDNEVAILAPQLGGIVYDRLEKDGLQWPCPDKNHPGTKFLHKDGEFARGKGLFSPAHWTPPAEVPDEDFPFTLSSGRRLYHYHTRTQTGRCGGLNELLSKETADISPFDAKKLGINDGELIRVSSRRGAVLVSAKIVPSMPEGLVWMTFHFRESNANWLTNPAFDPVTKTAEYKACAVKIEKIKPA